MYHKISITFFILFWSFLSGSLCFSQEVDYSLGEIKVEANLQSYYQEDTKREVLDSLLQGKYSFMNLGDVLKEQGGIMISSYGSKGSLSGVKIRGTGDNHTRFHWNGIPMNSLTTGTMDASLIPAGFMQNVAITKGASGVLAGNASFGGAIYLNNEANWNEKSNISINAETGSFGYHALMPSIVLSSKKVQYRASFQRIVSDNDFKFKDVYKSGSPVERQKNDTLRQHGLIQNVFLRFDGNYLLDLGLWVQTKSKDIPPVMGSYQAQIANQKDRSIKTYLKLNKLFAKSRLQFQLAYLKDSLHYTQMNSDKFADLLIDSRIQTQNVFSKIEWRWFVSRYITLDIGTHTEHPSAIVNSYGEERKENRISLISAAKFRHMGWVANLGVRKEFNPYKPPKPLASLGLSRRSKNTQSLIRANISNKFRIPSFNERYWQPGGNPDLKPESGWGGEVAWELRNPRDKKYLHKIETVIFYQKINNWIQWVPSVGYWHPVNQDLMISKGFEFNGSSGTSFGNLNTDLVYKYSYTNAKQAQNDNPDLLDPVIYVPNHQTLIGLNLGHKKLKLGCSYQYLGKRYTTADLSTVFMLDAIHLISLSGSYQYETGNLHFEFFSRINNLGNYSYQMIRSYATPGLTGTIGMKINYSQKK